MNILDFVQIRRGEGISKAKFNFDNIGYCNYHYGAIYKNQSLVYNEEKSPYYDGVPKVKIHKGDIVFVGTSETVEELGIFVIKDTDIDACAGMETYAIRVTNRDICNPKWLNIYFNSEYFKKYVRSFVTGIKVYRSNPNLFLDIEINLPTLEVQNEIVDRISAYDDKIENNNKIINTLEEMASLLYKRYFVDFEFPNDEGKPYKSNGGQFMDSELGRLPIDWEVKKYEVLNITYGKSFVKSKLQDNGFDVYGANGVMGYTNTYNFSENKVIIGCRGVVGNTIFTRKNSSISSNALIFNTDNNLKNYIYFYSKTQNYVDVTTGSVQKQITITNINNKKLIIPNMDVINRLNKKVDPIMVKMETLFEENLVLEKMRDLLINELIK